MVMVFDRAQLSRAALQIEASPPQPRYSPRLGRSLLAGHDLVAQRGAGRYLRGRPYDRPT